MDIEKLLQTNRQFLALTSLYPREFEELLLPFSERWRQFFKYHTLRGKRRIKPLRTKRLDGPTPTLPTAVDKLFFIFYFFKGYQSYRPKRVHLLEPYKARRNHPLSDWQKDFNHWISSIRIVYEHAISGIKRCRVAKEKLRYFDQDFRDQVFQIACGLHNLRVSHRATYANSAARVRARINLYFYQS